MIWIFILHLFLTNVASAAPDTTGTSPKDHTIVKSTQYSASYEIKRDLLLTEFKIRTSASENAVTIIYQTRLALVTLLMGFLIFMFDRSRKGENHALSKWIFCLPLILVFFMYWSDCYILELYDRVEHRAIEVARILDDLPSMKPDQIDILKTYSSLERKEPLQKVRLLFRFPKFAQILAYFPLVLMLIFLLIRTFSTTGKKAILILIGIAVALVILWLTNIAKLAVTTILLVLSIIIIGGISNWFGIKRQESTAPAEE
jgi:hypothetical protein